MITGRMERKLVRSFGRLERDIMRAIWRAGQPVTGHEVAAQLNPGREIAYTTLITVIDRLRDKGLLTRFRDGRSFRYEPVVPEDEYAAGLMAQVLDATHDRPRALLRFAGQLDPAEADALRVALSRTGDADAAWMDEVPR